MNLPLLLLLLGVSQKENQQWENFKLTYNKIYDSVQEEVQRKAIFLENVKEIEAHNEKFKQGMETFAKGVNEYSDMEENEFKEKILGIKFKEEEDPMIVLQQEALKTEQHRQWKEFKMTHEKEYESHYQEMVRKTIFNENVKMINEHNERYHNGYETFFMGINQFTDLTNEEFKEKYLNFRPLNATVYNSVEESFVETDKNEEELKLTSKSYYYTKDIPIKNQGECGSCWAFSVTAVLEYAYYLFNNKKLVSLSEQELVDCDHKSHGCNGGIPYYTFQWVHQNGINFEKEYPYEKRQNSCRRKGTNVGPSIIKQVGFTAANEKEMLAKMQEVGPIQVAVCADRWQHYKGGHFTPGNCNGRMSNHAVVVVGAANDKGTNVWVLRNSWGAQWGIQGHAFATMFQNTCNIQQQSASYINH